MQPSRGTSGGRSYEVFMSPRKLDELAANLEDASTVVEELRDEADVDVRKEKLDDLQTTLEDASDTLDEMSDKDD
jgi:hypothetical protein